jgi:glycosyltransferase involved in cell wall biosynthesis
MAESISVLIATYNCAHFLPQCLESICAQTSQPDEVIVVDDGSVDNTREVMRRFPSVRYIQAQHGGKSAAFNRAVSESTGDILCHLDADDYWMPRKLERVREELANKPTLGGVIHETEHVNEGGRRIELGGSPQAPKMPAVVTLGNSEELHFLYSVPGAKGFFAGNPNTSVVRRHALVDVFPLWPDMGLAVDAVFVFAALRYGLLYLPELLSAYRHHGNNAWMRNPRRAQDIIRMFQFLLLNEAYKNHLSPRQIKLVKARILEMTAYDSCLTGDNKFRGAVAGIKVPLALLRNGLFFNWRHLALPLMCFIPVKRPAFKSPALRT